MSIRRFLSSGRNSSSSLIAHLLVPPLCLATLLYGPPLEAIETAIEARQRLEVVSPAPEPTPSRESSASRSDEKSASVDVRFAQKADPPPSLPRGVTKAGTTWNLLSIPNDPASTDPADVLDPIDGAYTRALWWDACAETPGWRTYAPSDVASATLVEIDPPKGLWIETDATELPSEGTLPTSTSIQLCPGWNLVGFPAGQTRHVRAALASIEGKYERLYAYDPTDTSDPWAIYDVTVPAWANDLEVLEPGRGYWILATEATTLEIVNEATPPEVAFTTPADLDVVTAPTAVTGTVTSPLLDQWTLSHRLVGETEWQILASERYPVGSGTEAGELATFDPTLLLNGMHQLRLEAVDFQGRSVEETISVTVDGQMKIGYFTLSFIDLQIPLSGLDLQVVRTYDSRDKRPGDFGVGWTLDIRQGLYQNNRPPGDGWQIVQPGGPFALPCSQVIESKSHLTTIRLSDQEVYRFRLKVQNPGTIIGGCIADAVFEYVDGPIPGATLEILGNDRVLYQNEGDTLVDPDTFARFEPDDVKLRTRDGRIFHLDLQDGVTHLEDLHGNTLEITPDGITHSSGRGVEFVRNAAGRIETIRDPKGQENSYLYDETTGDLLAHTDRVGEVTTFVYGSNHFLEDIVNADDVRAVRTEYDADGRMVRMIDAAGRAIDLQHNLDARQEIVTNRLGHTRILYYDERGNVTREEDELGHATVRTYDGRDNLLTEKNPLGHTTTYSYDPATDDLLSITDPLGHVTTFTYHPLGLPETITDPLGNVTTNRYLPNGDLEWTEDALQHKTHFTYTPKGELESVEDALEHTTRFEYDDFGNLEKETDALGNITRYTHDDHGNRETETRTRTTTPVGGEPKTETLVTSFTYDALDRVTVVTAPDGSATRTQYDELGRVWQQHDENRRNTVFGYDDRGRQHWTRTPDLQLTVRRYDDEGRVVESEDPLKRVTKYSYDPVGRLLTTTYPGPDKPTVTNEYDDAGRLIATTDARGNETRYVYDDAGRRRQVIDPLGFVTKYDFDDAGRLERVTDAKGFVTTYQYDKVGRLRFTIAPDGSKVETIYDALGRREAMIDQEGKRTEYGYDALGRLTSVTDALGQVTSYTYDEVGNFTSQTDANSHTTRFVYDSMGRQVARILPGGGHDLSRYDQAGRMEEEHTLSGSMRLYEHDNAGRVLQRRYPLRDEQVDITYNGVGLRETIKDRAGRVTVLQYDERNRLKRKIDPRGWVLDYGYDSAGNRTSLEAIVGDETLETSYTFDELNRIETVTDPSGGMYTYTYDPNGNPETLTYPNGVVTTWTFDSQNRLDDLVTKDAAGEVLQSYDYTLALTGHRTAIEERGVPRSGTRRDYEYDDLWRLTEDRVTRPDGTLEYRHEFQYDPVGNRLFDTLTVDVWRGRIAGYSYDERDRLVLRNGRPWEWDRGGRLLEEAGYEGWEIPGRSYEWDDDERLLSVEWTERERLVGVDPGRLENVYDADGNRIESTEVQDGESTTTQYLVDESGWLSHVVAEIRDGEVVTHYQRAGDQLLGLVREGSAADRYFHLDGLGSVRGLSDASGVVTDRYEYTAYGERLESGADPQPYGFTAEPWSSVMELAHHRARWMDPAMGRFLSVDPFPGWLFDPASQAAYSYTSQNPVNSSDSSGLFTVNQVVFGASAGALVAGISTVPVNYALGQPTTVRQIIEAGILGGLLGGALVAAPLVGLVLFPYFAYQTIAFTIDVMSNPQAEVGQKAVAGVLLLALLAGGGAGLRQLRSLRSSASTSANASTSTPASLSARGLRPPPGTRVLPREIPGNWKIAPTRGTGGVRYFDPKNPGNSIRVMPGNPSSPYPNSRQPYVRWQRNGQALDKEGNMVPKNSTEAHIPLDQFRFFSEIFQ